MAEIKVEDRKAIQTLREIVGSDELFPYVDYDPADPDVSISITLYKKDKDNPNLKYGSKEFSEDSVNKLSDPLRVMLIQELWRFNTDQEVIEKLKSLGITLKFPNVKSSRFF